jgi:hypothetical protein
MRRGAIRSLRRRPPRPPSLFRGHRLYLVLGLSALMVVVVSRPGCRPAPVVVIPQLADELKAMSNGLKTGAVYRAPDGRFTIRPPAGWRIVQPAPAGYDAAFLSPNGPDLRISTQAVPDDSFPTLWQAIEEQRRQSGVAMEIESDRFLEKRAIRRIVQLNGPRLLLLDFAEQGVWHHLEFSCDASVFGDYLPVMTEVLNTYIPSPNAAAAP